MLQVRFPAAFHVEYYAQNTCRRTGMNCRGGQVGGQMLSCLVLALVKCTRIYFSGAQEAPCFMVHSKHSLWTVCSVLQFSSVNLPDARVFTSSSKPVQEAGTDRMLQALIRLALYLRKRIGDSGEPCGMPVCVGKA